MHSTGQSQWEVNLMLLPEIQRKPARPCRTLLCKTKELRLPPPTPPIIETLPPPNPDLCSLMGPTLLYPPPGTDIPQVRSVLCPEEIRVKLRCCISHPISFIPWPISKAGKSLTIKEMFPPVLGTGAKLYFQTRVFMDTKSLFFYTVFLSVVP